MELGTLIMLVALLVSCLVQGIMAMSIHERELQKQLMSINKPSVKSFRTKHGDILDCVEIHKQLAFDHPLLRNHSIQMKPTKCLSKPVKTSSKLTVQKILPGNVRCPKGTVLIKRVQKQDLLQAKKSNLFRSYARISNSKKSVSLDANQVAMGYEAAYLTMRGKSSGVHGNVNLWQPDVAENQISSGSIFVDSFDGPLINTIAAGWSVDSQLYQNSSRLYMYWSKDSGKTTGCYNILCPGFVQVSQIITPGVVLQPLSTYDGSQFDIILSIKQDTKTGNWWVNLQDKDVGYYPKEIFTTLTRGGDEVGWGGEVAGPATQPLPGMGSGHFPEDGFQKAAFINGMAMFDPNGAQVYPAITSLQKIETKSKCYRTLYVGDMGQAGYAMYFGGPPDCKL